jgi:hypothetical protein
MTHTRFSHSEIHGSMLAWQLPVAYRSLQRPSSASSAKASTGCPLQLAETMLALVMEFSRYAILDPLRRLRGWRSAETFSWRSTTRFTAGPARDNDLSRRTSSHHDRRVRDRILQSCTVCPTPLIIDGLSHDYLQRDSLPKTGEIRRVE